MCGNETKVTSKKFDGNWGNLYTRNLPHSNIFLLYEYNLFYLEVNLMPYGFLLVTNNSLLFSARSKFLGGGRVGGLRMCHPPYHPLDFQGKIKNFCHPTLLKIRFKITVTPPPPPKKGQSQTYGASITLMVC